MTSNGRSILLLNTSDSYGGAARSTRRIKQSLDSVRDKITLAVKHKGLNDPETIRIERKSFIYLIPEIFRLLFLKFFILRSFKTGNPNLHSPAYISKMDVGKTICDVKPDIVHLNWIGHNLITIEEVGKITQPVVWTLHDMWAFCGAEHVVYDDRYVAGYNDSNRPETESGFDLNRWTWERKLKAFAGIKNLHIVCPSEWLACCVRKSPLFKTRNLSVIPNGLDTEIFKPCEDKMLRRKLQLPENRKILLFGAVDSLSDRNKGYDLLIEAAYNLSKTQLEIQLVVFGNKKATPNEIAGIPLLGLGEISDDAKLAELYSAADLTVVPSRIESFGQTASESLACGTPVACFDTSGLKSVVDHQVNGYRAGCYDCADLASGITWLLSDGDRLRAMSVNGRKKAERVFSLQALAESYRQVYSSILGETGSANAH